MKTSFIRIPPAATFLAVASLATVGQDRLKSMRGEDQSQKMAREIPTA